MIHILRPELFNFVVSTIACGDLRCDGSIDQLIREDTQRALPIRRLLRSRPLVGGNLVSRIAQQQTIHDLADVVVQTIETSEDEPHADYEA